jgi:hypothetical protein
MDPATIGLLISIAPTVLELLFSERDQRSLFGRGNNIDIKHETVPKRHVQRTLLENPKVKMYGYGLEGYGYRYPPIEGYYDEPIKLGTITKGPRKGLEIKRYPPKVDKRWVAAYLLNKQYGANRWREIAKKYLQAASQEYLNELKKTDRAAYAKALLNKQRKRKRDKLPLALRTPEGESLLKELLPFKEDKAKLLEAYYGKPRKPRKVKALKPEEIEEIIKEYEGLQVEEPIVAKK